MEKLRAIIVDDEKLGRRRILDLLKQVGGIDVLQECESGRSAVLKINSLRPDIVFLDINMNDMNGLEVLQNIVVEPKPKIIFVTAHDKFAKDAFDYEAFDFLLKPFEDERFFRTVKRALNSSDHKADDLISLKLTEFLQMSSIKERNRNLSTVLPVRQGNKTTLVNLLHINYLIASGSYAEIFTVDKKHVIRETLSNLLEVLDEEQFLRISRSAIVNINFVQEIIHSNRSEMDVKMKDGKILRVSKTQKKAFLNKIGY